MVQAGVAVDRGHKHSDGSSEVCIWIMQAPSARGKGKGKEAIPGILGESVTHCNKLESVWQVPVLEVQPVERIVVPEVPQVQAVVEALPVPQVQTFEDVAVLPTQTLQSFLADADVTHDADLPVAKRARINEEIDVLEFDAPTVAADDWWQHFWDQLGLLSTNFETMSHVLEQLAIPCFR